MKRGDQGLTFWRLRSKKEKPFRRQTTKSKSECRGKKKRGAEKLRRGAVAPRCLLKNSSVLAIPGPARRGSSSPVENGQIRGKLAPSPLSSGAADFSR